MQLLSSRINGSIAVIGDVHGQVEKLLVILDRLRELPDFEDRWIVLIGDIVDRGPDPKGALDVVTDLVIGHARTTAVCGNHDFAMSAALGLIPTPSFSNWSERWLDHYDAETTFESYGSTMGDIPDLIERLPDRHRDFLAAMPWCVEHPKYLFVHAGLDTNSPFDVQMRILRQKDFSLNRPQWLCSKALVQADPPPKCPFTVVSGHTSVPAVEFRPKRILVDTTGGRDGDLSCVLLPEHKVLTSAMESPDDIPRSWWKLWKR